MAGEAERGDHGLTRFKRLDEAQGEALWLQKTVLEAETDAIKARRAYIKGKKERDRTSAPLTGLALSGGGIRSASFGLGVLQALHVTSGIEGIDYISTVSGGGYIGSSLTATMQKTGGAFPFTNPVNYDDTDSVRHIRDFSNYLIPHGILDAVTALGIIGRGLIANILIILPVLLFFVWLTLVIHPTIESLGEPAFSFWNFESLVKQLGLEDLHGYWFTAILAGANIVFLIIWAFAKSVSVSRFWQNGFAKRRRPGDSAELRGGLVTFSKLLFFVTVITAWLETQPFILYAIAQSSGSLAAEAPPALLSGAAIGKILQGWFSYLTPILAPLGAVFAFFSKYFVDIAGLAARDPRWQARIKKILAMAALWFAAVIIPSFLWLLYLEFSFFGLATSGGAYPNAPAWLVSLAKAAPFQGLWQKAGMTAAAGFYFDAFLVTGLVALFINPNVTSLYRLYRDRLSKAFLFDPDGRPASRDKYGDLQPFEPKLHEIDTRLCPYPVINAALNLEGSQYANKRGRNADFFIFTPEFTGSDATGYVGTRRIEAEETALDLGSAMAISAAAVSSNMGSATIKLISFTLAILNVRLGYWLRNPRQITGRPAWYSRIFDIRSFLLFKEMFSLIDEKSPTVYLTDGGHIENLGVYSLLKRGCRVIIAVDAEADPMMTFHSLLRLERYARIDLGVIINLPWQAIRDCSMSVNKAFAEAAKSGGGIPCSPGPHCAAGEIQYGPGESGILIYIKASLSGDEDDYILDYKRRNSAFPHETTGDQFFDEEQLEAYRALGFHIVKGLLRGETPLAVTMDPKEPESKKQARILNELRAALLGI
ncbi:MAG TPA: patatin-like phospholipase family protein [Methylocella sp.]|nr:patatin-like phospholipase family protein [Methylocella sp.]